MNLRDLFDLTDRTALVTGGSRGLGFQIASALGEYGAHVILVARKAGELEEAVAELGRLGVSASGIAGDLGSSDGVAQLVEELRRNVPVLDILVNCAGATWGAPAETYPLDAWTKVITLNLTSLFQLTQAVAAGWLIPQGQGSVINVATVEGLQAHHPRQPGTAAYNASKGGVINLTRALAAEWGRHKLRVNALAPGYFVTRMTARTIDDLGAAMIDNTPLGTLGGDDDLKGAALLLASRAGAHITGQVIVVDGGATII